MRNSKKHINVLFNRSALFHIATALIVMCRTVSAEIEIKMVKNPSWELADVFMSAVDDVYGHRATYTQDGIAFLSEAFGDTYIADRGRSQLYPGGPTQNSDFRRAVAGAGGFDSDVFLRSDLDAPAVVIRGATIVPSTTTFTGISINGAEAPIIDPDIFPITNTWAKEYRDGDDLFEGFECEECAPRQVDSLGSTGVVTDENGVQRDYSGQNWTHFPFWTEMNWLDGLARTEAVGEYEALIEYRDSHGNGWDVTHFYSVVPRPTQVDGDLSYNNELDASDLDVLVRNVALGSTDNRLDLNGDNAVDVNDVQYWVTDLRNTWIGDANLDGRFNSGDFVDVFQAGKYEQDDLALWREGDWNGDERFDSRDFVAAFQDGGYEMGARAAVAAVPEPSSLLLLLFGMLGIGRIRRR